MNSLADEIQRPILQEPDWWTAIKAYPKRIIDQHFGYELLEEDLARDNLQFHDLMRPRVESFTQNKTGYSEVHITEDTFLVSLKTRQFERQELDVKVVKGFVVISGAHGYMKTASGYSCRGFERRYMLPQDFSGKNMDVFYKIRENCLRIKVTKDNTVGESVEIRAEE